jgi:hypothetical protein
MSKTDTTEKGLETLIMRHMTGTDGLASGVEVGVAETAPAKGGSGWLAGNDSAYDREFAVDTEQLFAFLIATQPEEWAKLGIADYKDKETVISDARRKGKRVLEVRLDNIKDPNRVAVRFRSDTSADPEAAVRDDENERRPRRERHPVVTIGAVGADTGPVTGLSDGEAPSSGGAAESGETAPSGSGWRKHRG